MLVALLGLLYVDHYTQINTREAQHVEEKDERVLWADWRQQFELRGEKVPVEKPAKPPAVYYGVSGVGLLLLLMIILPLATVEVARLFTAENVQPYRFISAAGSGSLVI